VPALPSGEINTPKTTTMKMPFGKHSGIEIEELPEDYINWLLDQDWIRDPKNKNLLAALEAVKKHGPGNVLINSQKVAGVYRELMSKYTGNAHAMAALTEFKDRILL
jgi:uncharacterized protein (DUF3820 family)